MLQAKCLVLDKRYPYFQSYIYPTFQQEFGIEVEEFIVGDGKDDLPYDLIDTNELPPNLPNSIQYSTWHNRPNAYNAWKSHREMIRLSLQENLDYVLFLEDDIFIPEENYSILKNSLKHYKEGVFDMWYLGSYNANKKGKWYTGNDDTNILNLPQKSGCGGFHAVILNKRVLSRLYDAFKPIGPYDHIAANYLHGIYECYASYPSLILQRSGYSFVEGHHLDKPVEEL